MLTSRSPYLHPRYWNIVYYCYHYCLVSMKHYWFIITMSLLHLQTYYYSQHLPFFALRIVIMVGSVLVFRHLPIAHWLELKFMEGLRHSYYISQQLCFSQWKTLLSFLLTQQKCILDWVGMIPWVVLKFQTLTCYPRCRILLACT